MYKVCVIGAGVAGLKAAQRLVTGPFAASDVLVVEAQGRTGGRVWTDKESSKLGYRYDLGAAWFHDCLTNVVLEESLKDGSFRPENGYFDDKEVPVYDAADGKLAAADLRLAVIMEEVLKFVEVYFYEDLDKPDLSLMELVDVYFAKYGDRLTADQKKYTRQMIRRLELWHGSSSDTISAKYGVLEHQGRNLYNKIGYSFLTEKLLRQISGVTVDLNRQVTGIDRRNRANGKPIAVATSNGPVYCDYVVVTVPLSILQLEAPDPYAIKWEPPLPADIQAALGNTSFAALGKVILEFDTVWWPRNEDRFAILSEDPDVTQLSAPLTALPAKMRYPLEIVNYSAVHKDGAKGGSLVILVQRPLTDYLERNPQDAWPFFKKALSKLSVDGVVTDPINVITSQWTTNPYIRGSYTGVGVGENPVDVITVLSGEVESVGLASSPVRFAGEHTIGEGAGCVHGAYMSGDREARWIIADYSARGSKL